MEITNTREYQTVVLAALLHDIGKLINRGKFPELDKGQHPVFSAQFIKAHSALFSGVADAVLLEQLVLAHHEDKLHFPQELLVQSIKDNHVRALASLVSRADNLSSSERGRKSEQWQDYKTTPLACVLERVQQDNITRPSHNYHAMPLENVDSPNFKSIFPEQFEHYNKTELNQLIKDFGAYFTRTFTSPGNEANRANFEILISHLFHALYRHCWCIASNTQEDFPDVSLFDHLKTTASIASCLYLYHSQTDTLDESTIRHPDGNQFCLVAGDISGIQNYIYDIASIGVGGGVARRLRARSLYVQLCSEVAAHRLLRQANLPLCLHALMNSGGRFYLLLPNLPDIKETLKETQRESDKWFLRELNGELSLNLASVEFGDSGFKPEGHASGFGNALNHLASALNEQKQRRFAHSLIEKANWQESAFVLPDSYEGQGPCRSCHKFPQKEEGLCQYCLLDQKVGSRLPQTKYIAFYDSSEGMLPILDYSVSLTDAPPALKGASPYMLLQLDDPALSGLSNIPAAVKYLANFVAPPDDCPICQEENPRQASFACLAQRSRGKEMLGFLKADVDNLGKLFVFGLKRESDSLDTVSRICTLSRMLDIFFTGWVEHLARENGNLYVVYSGGDDLLVVGPWTDIISFAARLRADFNKFTSNPAITLSAGITITRPDYPIARAARDADDALEKAKSNNAGDVQKDSITLLGRTLQWQEWERVQQIWEKLRPSLGQIPSAFLYRLLAFGNMWQEYRSGNTLGLRLFPFLAYSIARNLDARKTPEFYQWVDGLLNIRPGDKEQEFVLDNLGLITTLLIYSRKEGHHDER